MITGTAFALGLAAMGWIAAGYVGKSMGGESSMLVCAIFGVIAGYLGGDAVGSGIQEYYRSEERRS